MKSIFRVYAKTSKGNDTNLLNQLRQLNLQPKYDQHLNSFYFNSNFYNLFDISFKCLTVQQMYVQIGQKFRLIDQQQIKFQLQRLPFKNYIPIKRGLIENTTLKILIRESSYMPSQNVLINLFQTCLNRQIIKKQYYKQIVQSNQLIDDQDEEEQNYSLQEQSTSVHQSKHQLMLKNRRKTNESFYEIRDIVEKKWFQQDLKKQQAITYQMLQLQNQIKSLSNKSKNNTQNLLSNASYHQNALNSQSEKHNIQLHQNLTVQQKINKLKDQLIELKNYDKEQFLQQQLAYHPHLVFYIRNNKGRFLLKINKDQLYKHGWKSSVNYGPIRQSIAASILHQSGILKQKLQNNKTLKIWDPMCGSGTIPLVATTMLDQVPIRNDIQKLFEWQNWPIYNQKYLNQYKEQLQRIKKQKMLKYQIILSDKDRQTLNYSINNFRNLLEKYQINSNQENNQQNKANNKINSLEDSQKQSKQEISKQANFLEQLFPNKTVHSEILQLVNNKIGFACGDFQEVMKLMVNKCNKSSNKKKSKQQKDTSSNQQPQNKQQHNISSQSKLNIITNLPYIHGRSQQKNPLNQLLSIYKRFSSMINQYKQYIDNVFIIIDKNITDRNHFLNISTQKWNLISQYTSGGIQIGLYAWDQNKIKSNLQNKSNQLILTNQLQMSSEQRQIILKKQKSLEKALINYRAKLSQIDRKYYNIPKYLTKNAKGWKRIIQKRRKRHLQSAYQIFAKRRDKLIALKQYARLKLQLKMLKRGTVWKSKNLNLFNNEDQKLQNYQHEIKEMFQKKIQDALKRQQQYKERKKIKQGDKIQIVKMRNKWNSDPKNMVRQIKESKFNKKKQVKGQRRK